MPLGLSTCHCDVTIVIIKRETISPRHDKRERERETLREKEIIRNIYIDTDKSTPRPYIRYGRRKKKEDNNDSAKNNIDLVMTISRPTLPP